MAMLAEPRRKQKWTLNPRGKQWSEDSNKFGQKMLEKMGWTNGKGLGANEQGMTEHVKVSYKNNQSGIGFKDTDDQWTHHAADFNDLLSQLQQQNSNTGTLVQLNEEKAESLELKSKQSRARVHYHKFTRGKDVKKYSSKDLANIFGKKELADAADALNTEMPVEPTVAEPKGYKDNTGGVLTIKGGNIDEYFRNKLPNFFKKDNSNNDENETEPRLGFGFSSTRVSNELQASNKDSVSSFAFANHELDLDCSKKESESEKPNIEIAYDNSYLHPEKRTNGTQKCAVPFSNQGFINPALNLNDSSIEKNNGAEFEVSRLEFGLDNNALDLSDEENRKKRVTFNDKVEYNTDVIKKKKKKAKNKLDKFEVDNAKLRRKVKEDATKIGASNEVTGFVNEALDIEVINDEIIDNETNELRTKKRKRRKRRRESNLETIPEITDENINFDEAVTFNNAPTEKNKKLGINIRGETSSDISAIPIEAQEIQKRKKKDLENIIPVEPVSEKKCKKKKQKARESQDTEITVLAEISRKLSKSRKNKVAESPQSSETRQEKIEVMETKTKDGKRFKLKSKRKDTTEVDVDQVIIQKSGTATKRKSSEIEIGVNSMKKSKVDDLGATEDTGDLEQNTDIPVDSAKFPNFCDKKGKRSNKIFKSLFAKTPTLYFSGSNINEMAGYGSTFTDVKR